MSILAQVFASVAALLHIVFFSMESLFWMNPSVHGLFGVETVAEAETLAFAMYNQGWYNLFVALGCIVGLVLVRRGKEAVGTGLVVYACLFMVGAALVLVTAEFSLLRGALIQGAAPAVALGLHFFMKRAKYNQRL